MILRSDGGRTELGRVANLGLQEAFTGISATGRITLALLQSKQNKGEEMVKIFLKKSHDSQISDNRSIQNRPHNAMMA